MDGYTQDEMDQQFTEDEAEAERVVVPCCGQPATYCECPEWRRAREWFRAGGAERHTP